MPAHSVAQYLARVAQLNVQLGHLPNSFDGDVRNFQRHAVWTLRNVRMAKERERERERTRE